MGGAGDEGMDSWSQHGVNVLINSCSRFMESFMCLKKFSQESNAPATRMAMTRRVHPLVSLNPYQGNWTIKVRLTNKGNLRSYRNARGEGHVFNVELADEDGTQVQATMFIEAAKKFYPKFELGKVYYISKGSLGEANKQFKTVKQFELLLISSQTVMDIRSWLMLSL